MLVNFMLSLISKFLASRAVTVVLMLLLSGGAWFIYSELQAKVVIEKELKDIKANQTVVNAADKGLVQAESAVKHRSEQIKLQVSNAINADSGDITNESIRLILCANGLAHPSACVDPRPLPD